MKGQSARRRIASLAGLSVASLVSRLPLILHPPAGFYYNHDELSVTFAALDRFLGLPATLLMLPASLLQFLYLPLFLTDMAVRRGLPAGAGAFLAELSAQLSQAYAEPRHAVTLMRCLVVAITCAAPALAYGVVEASGASAGAALLGAALVFVNPVFLQQSVMAAADAVAPTLALAAVLCLLKTRWGGNFQYAGFLLAAGLASRITLAGFAAVPILYLLFHGGTSDGSVRRKGVIRFCLGLILGFLFWCPYVWTDPVRMAKALYGNFNRPESYVDLGAFAQVAWQGMGAGACAAWTVLFAAGCWMALRYRPALGAAAVAGTALMCVPLLLRSSTVVPRYFLPLLPCMVILWAVVAGKPQPHPFLRKMIFGALAFSAATMAVECVWREREVRKPIELDEALRIITTLPNGTNVYLPDWLLAEGRIQLPRDACERLRAKLSGATSVIRFAEGRGIPREAAESLLTDFNEKEQAEAARLAMVCRSAPESSQSVFLYYQPGDFQPSRALADMSEQEALDRVRAQAGSAIFVEELTIPWAAPIWKGSGEWAWYKGPEIRP